MAFALVGYPDLSKPDASWIRSVRREHDGLFTEVIEPHFTFVFPVGEIDEETFLGHVRTVAAGRGPISFALLCAVVWDDVGTDYFHVLLVPDEGHSEMVMLHDRLYEGPLERHLLVEVPFIPHLGVGNDLDPWESRRIALELNDEGFEIEGRIDRLTVVDYRGGLHRRSGDRSGHRLIAVRTRREGRCSASPETGEVSTISSARILVTSAAPVRPWRCASQLSLRRHVKGSPHSL